eukprot:8679850-Ditylum_brightwellii.AAC.1
MDAHVSLCHLTSTEDMQQKKLFKTCRINPDLLAYEYLNSTADYNATPLVPPGVKVLIHKKVDQKTLLGLHGKE